MYSHTLAIDFGPLALKAIRDKMIGFNWSRTTVNAGVHRIRRMFRWAVAEELLPPPTYQALAALPGLRQGRSEAREAPPVGPVAESVVEATLPFLPAVVADMVRLERLCAMRPGAVCAIRPGDVDRAGDVWEYVPERHKTQHHGRQRIVFIGPRGQRILTPYLLRRFKCKRVRGSSCHC